MKKYLMSATAMMALAIFATSCSNEASLYDPEASHKKLEMTYSKSFEENVGTPNKNQTWGFGESVAASRMTRAGQYNAPTFRDTNPITKPTTDISTTLPANAKYAKNYQNYQKDDVIYIDSDYSTLNNPQNTENLTIYVVGTVTYTGGTNQNGNGTKFVVTDGSTLKLGSVSNNLTVVLGKNATLDITEGLNRDGTPAVDYVWNAQKNANDLVPRTSFTFQNSHAAIYMAEGSTVKAGKLSLVGGAKMLNAGGTIEATELALDQECTLWNEGTVTVSNNLKVNNTRSYIYNATGKTITAGSIDIDNNDCLIYNDGTVKTTGTLTTHNSKAEFINNGTLEAATLNMGAGGKLHNEDIVNISGESKLTNAQTAWQNDGIYTSGTFTCMNDRLVFNNCHLYVKGEFHVNESTVTLNGGAAIEAKSMVWELNSDMFLGSKAIMKVEGDLLTKNANSGYGFYAIGDDYAVLQANAIKHEGNEQFRMSYFGKLLVATSNHFAQWYKDAPNTNQPAYYYEKDVKFTFNNENIATIPASKCSPGYEGEGGDTEVIREQGRIMCEDLGTIGDFDFNDVVFDATIYENSTTHEVTRTEITLLAAGGTLYLTVAGEEVHAKFGVATNIMVNTGLEAPKGASKDAVTFTTAQPYEHLIEIPIVVRKQDGQYVDYFELTSIKGQAPQKICVPIGTKWCDEYVSITKAYPKFKDWVEGENPFDWSWIKTIVEKYTDLNLRNND